MCNYYVGQTADGQTVVYYVAEGVTGQQAMRDIRRRCEGGHVKAVSRQEAMALTRPDAAIAATSAENAASSR